MYSWERRVQITLKGCWVIARIGIIFPVRGYRYHHKFRVIIPREWRKTCWIFPMS